MSPKRPYSPWRRAGDLVVISGQLGVLPERETLTLAEGGAPGQLRQALSNAATVLSTAGVALHDVVKASLYVLNMEDFDACNEVWLDTFSDPLPTRTAVAVAQLPYGASVEVELWAYAPER